MASFPLYVCCMACSAVGDVQLIHAPSPGPRPARNKASLWAQVDVLITVSGFCTMPTLSTAVAAKFGMRSDLDAYHLGGHGCAASTMSIFLARQLLLAVRPAARIG